MENVCSAQGALHGLASPEALGFHIVILLPPSFGVTNHFPGSRSSFRWQLPAWDEPLCSSHRDYKHGCSWLAEDQHNLLSCLGASSGRECCLCCHPALASRGRGLGLQHAYLCISHDAQLAMVVLTPAPAEPGEPPLRAREGFGLCH